MHAAFLFAAMSVWVGASSAIAGSAATGGAAAGGGANSGSSHSAAGTAAAGGMAVASRGSADLRHGERVPPGRNETAEEAAIRQFGGLGLVSLTNQSINGMPTVLAVFKLHEPLTEEGRKRINRAGYVSTTYHDNLFFCHTDPKYKRTEPRKPDYCITFIPDQPAA